MNKIVGIFWCRPTSEIFKQALSRIANLLNNYEELEPNIGAYAMPCTSIFLIESEFTKEEIQIVLGQIDCAYLLFHVDEDDNIPFRLPEELSHSFDAFNAGILKDYQQGKITSDEVIAAASSALREEKRVNTMTRDDLLDLIKERGGVDKLTDIEKNRLEELSRE